MTGFVLADIGGTHARFAVLRDGRLGKIDSLSVAAHATPDDALRRFLDRQPAGERPARAILAVAGPVSQGRARLTNGTWVLDGDVLAKRFGFAAVTIVNDLEALAHAVPRLGPADWQRIGGGRAVGGAPAAIVAPGTGLGMACLVGGPAEQVLTSEGGHASLAANDDDEAAIVAVLRRRFGHVSAERVLSGRGLENIHQALGEIDGRSVEPRSAPQITRGALDGDSLCRRTLEQFCRFLGGVTGDAALFYGARAGVYIGGGIAPEIIDFLPGSGFREAFEGKGRLGDYTAAIPTGVIVRPDPAFLGLQGLALGSPPATDSHDG